MQPLVVLPHGLEDLVGPEDVGLDEGARVVERVVVVRLRCVVDDRVVGRDQRVDGVLVGDVADDELHPVLGQAGQRLLRGGVGELVEDGDAVVGVLDEVVHEVRPDEPRAPGHEKAFHGRESRARRVSEAEPVMLKLGCVTSPGSSYVARPRPSRAQPSGRALTPVALRPLDGDRHRLGDDHALRGEVELVGQVAVRRATGVRDDVRQGRLASSTAAGGSRRNSL